MSSGMGTPAAGPTGGTGEGQQLPPCLEGVELPKQVVADLQQLLQELQSGAVDIVLVPRASLTGETPCGHYIRVWAVAVPVASSGSADVEISITMTGTGALLSGAGTTAASWTRRTSAGATGMSHATATATATGGVGRTAVPLMRMTGDGVMHDPRLRKSRLGPGRAPSGSAGGATPTAAPESALVRTQALLHDNTTSLLHMTLQRNRTAATSLGGAFLLEEVMGAASSDGTEEEDQGSDKEVEDSRAGTMGDWASGAPTSPRDYPDSGSARRYASSGSQLRRRGSNLLALAGEGASASTQFDDDGMGGLSRMSSGVNPLAAVTVERLMSGGVDVFDDEGLADQMEVTTIVYVDEGCPNVLEALVHSWLSLRGHSLSLCRMAEAWVTLRAAAARGKAPSDALLVSDCQSSDVRYSTPSELLEMAAWAAAQEVAVGATHGLDRQQVAATVAKQQQVLQQGGKRSAQPSPQKEPAPSRAPAPAAGPAPKGQAPQWAGSALMSPFAALTDRLGGLLPGARAAPGAAAAGSDAGSASGGHAAASETSSTGTATLGRLDSSGNNALDRMGPGRSGPLPTVVESSSQGSSATQSSGSGASNTTGASSSAAATAGPMVLTTYAAALHPAQRMQVGRWLLTHVQRGAVDGIWLQSTYSEWRRQVRTIMVNSQIRSLAAAAAGSEGKSSERDSDSASESDVSLMTLEEEEEDEELLGYSRDTVGSSMVEDDGEDSEFLPLPPPAGAANGDTQPVVEQLLANTCDWILAHGCVTTGTMSVLRQVQRLCLEAAVPALLDAILECAKHTPDEYITDIDLMTVYLEQIGIANEVLQFFGIHKFRLGRILWLRHRALLPPTRLLTAPDPTSAAGSSSKGLSASSNSGSSLAHSSTAWHSAVSAGEAPEGQHMGRNKAAEAAAAAGRPGLAGAAATADRDILQKSAKGVYDMDAEKEAETRAQHAALFVMWVGNGLFWVVPFLLQWLLSRTIGSGLIDNGRLSEQYFKWWVWAFFVGYLIAGGYFNLLMHLQLYHRWRFAMPSMLMSMVQGWCSCLLLYGGCCSLLVAYAVLRYQSWEMAWFTALTFFLMAMYITQMLMLFCSTTSNSAWSGGPGRTVMLIFLAQCGVNQLSYRFSAYPIVENLVTLTGFMIIAGLMLWRNLRATQATWAEALTAPKGAQLSPDALQLLLNFHNATYVTSYTASSPKEDLARACAAAAALLVKKVQALRRLRLPLFYDQTVWVWPAGSLTHLFITMPFWTSELWSGDGWLGTNAIPLVVASMYVMLAGGYLEWLLALLSKADTKPTPRQQALINAAAAEAAATESLRRQVRSTSGGGARSALCDQCGCSGCSSGCGTNICGYLCAPPGARCVPRGSTYFFGWNVGFNPLEPLDANGEISNAGYWKQLFKMAVWHITMWWFGMLILLLIMAARQTGDVVSIAQFAKIFWTSLDQPVDYTLLCIGYSCYLTVGFNHVMGITLRMRQIVTYMFTGIVVGCLSTIPLSLAPAGVAHFIPALSVMITGITYLLLAIHPNIWAWLTKRGEDMRRRAFSFARIAKLEVIQTSGQSALTNTMVDHCEAAAALYRLQNSPGVSPQRIAPNGQLGGAAFRLLAEFKSSLGKPLSAAAAAAPGPPGLAAAAWVLRHFSVGYPLAADAVQQVLEKWQQGKIRVFRVPFSALNAEGGSPQYYALGVAALPEGGRPQDASGTYLDVYVALEEGGSSSKGASHEGGGASRDVLRVAEAVLHEGLEDLGKRMVPSTGSSLAHLDACLAEFALTAFRALQQLAGRGNTNNIPPLLPARVAAELSALTPPVLEGVGRRTASSVMCAALREMCWLSLAPEVGLNRELDARRLPDVAPPADALSGIDSSFVNDAWDYMSPGARVLLLHVIAAAASTAMAHLRGKPRNTCTRVSAVPQVVQCSQNMLAAAELQQLGQQVSLAPTPVTSLSGQHQGAMVQVMARIQLLTGLAMSVHEVVSQGATSAWPVGHSWQARASGWRRHQAQLTTAAIAAGPGAGAGAAAPRAAAEVPVPMSLPPPQPPPFTVVPVAALSGQPGRGAPQQPQQQQQLPPPAAARQGPWAGDIHTSAAAAAAASTAAATAGGRGGLSQQPAQQQQQPWQQQAQPQQQAQHQSWQQQTQQQQQQQQQQQPWQQQGQQQQQPRQPGPGLTALHLGALEHDESGYDLAQSGQVLSPFSSRASISSVGATATIVSESSGGGWETPLEGARSLASAGSWDNATFLPPPPGPQQQPGPTTAPHPAAGRLEAVQEGTEHTRTGHGFDHSMGSSVVATGGGLTSARNLVGEVGRGLAGTGAPRAATGPHPAPSSGLAGTGGAMAGGRGGSTTSLSTADSRKGLSSGSGGHASLDALADRTTTTTTTTTRQQGGASALAAGPSRSHFSLQPAAPAPTTTSTAPRPSSSSFSAAAGSAGAFPGSYAPTGTPSWSGAAPVGLPPTGRPPAGPSAAAAKGPRQRVPMVGRTPSQQQLQHQQPLPYHPQQPQQDDEEGDGQGGPQRAGSKSRFRQISYSRTEQLPDEVHTMSVATGTATVRGGFRSMRRLGGQQQQQQQDMEEMEERMLSAGASASHKYHLQMHGGSDGPLAEGTMEWEPSQPPPPPTTSSAPTVEQLEAAAWRAVPWYRRVAFHVHMGVRILWLALMGDPSFYQDAMDLVGAPPRPGAPWWSKLVGWTGYGARKGLLLLLGLVTRVSQALALQVCRVTLWWWPGAADVLLALGSSRNAVTAVSVFSGTNRLQRSLVIDRENMYSRFYVPLGMCDATLLPRPPTMTKKGRESAADSAAKEGGQAQEGDSNGAVTEQYLGQLAGCHVLQQLGLRYGRLVTTEVLIGVSENLDTSKSVTTTCYLLPGSRRWSRPGRRGWLPLWQIQRQSHAFTLWDYSAGTSGRGGASNWWGPACQVTTATPTEAERGDILVAIQGQLLAMGAQEAAAPLYRPAPPLPEVVRGAVYDHVGDCRSVSLQRNKREVPLDHELHAIREEDGEWSAAHSSKAGAAPPAAAEQAPLPALPEVVARSVKRMALSVYHESHLEVYQGRGSRGARVAAVSSNSKGRATQPGVQYVQGSLMLQPQELALPAGPGALTLLFTVAGMEAALGAAAAGVPAWVVQQLRLGEGATSHSSRQAPPAAALLRIEATGEEWLVAHDVLASASVAVNTYTLWPLQPQGVRCWQRKARSQASAAASSLLPVMGHQEHVDGFAMTNTAPRNSGGMSSGSSRQQRHGGDPDHMLTTVNNVQEHGADDWTEAGEEIVGHSGSSFVAAVIPVSQSSVPWKASAAAPEWLAPLLGTLSVPWAPTKATAPWQLPKDLLLVQRGSARQEGRLQIHTAGNGPDSGTSRALLWWLWNQGPGGCQKAVSPGKEVALPTDMAADAWRPGAIARLAGGLSRLASCFRRQQKQSEGGGEAAAKPQYVPVLDGLFCTITEELLMQREPALAPYWRSYHALSAAGCQKVLDPGAVPLLQYCLGTGLLSNTPGQHSHLAHSLETLAASNCVPGNAYSYYNPLAGVAEGAAAASAAAAAVAAGQGVAGGSGLGGSWLGPGAGGDTRAASQVAAALAPLRAVAMDSGTWPMDGGGVATCREQVVQGTEDVCWHGEAEVAHDLKQIIPKMRAQPHVSQVSLCLQWDTQHDSPNQSTFASVPYTRLTRRAYATTPSTVARRFLPLWRCLLHTMRKANGTSESADIRAMADAMVGMYEYFQTYDWDFTFADPQVSEVFAFEFQVAAACMPNTSTGRQVLGCSPPSQEELSALFDLFQHYLKTICVTLPSDITVTQASHHGLQAMTGLIAQLRRNQSLQVWDHGILIRERMIYLDCFKRNLLPHFVNEQITRLHRAAAQVLYRLTDLVVPCNASFNTLWELWLGTDRHRLMPLLNALEIEHYPSLQEHEAPQPTAAMLSHVYALKDIMSAIRAAAIIVHDYGITEYKLEVFGSLDFDKDYVTGCQALIKELKLENNVALRGLGSPTKVLAMTWIYIQTSISEGLPVSVIEAGLTGKCVVCTNVGGCAELLANPNAGAPGTSTGLAGPQPPMFGRLVAPKDVAMIAYAQLEVLGFLPSLQIPKLLKPPEVDVEELKRRIHDPEVRAQRHALGRLFRQFGLDQFRMSRYILQHRQALYTAHYKRLGAATAAAAAAAAAQAATQAGSGGAGSSNSSVVTMA